MWGSTPLLLPVSRPSLLAADPIDPYTCAGLGWAERQPRRAWHRVGRRRRGGQVRERARAAAAAARKTDKRGGPPTRNPLQTADTRTHSHKRAFPLLFGETLERAQAALDARWSGDGGEAGLTWALQVCVWCV